MSVPYRLFSVILPSKYFAIYWVNFKTNYLHHTIGMLVILKKWLYSDIQKILPSQFAVVYLDTTFITVKRGTAQKKALHVLLGITPSGEKHVVDYGIYPNDSTVAYKELLDHTKQRGLEDVLLFIGDGFQWLEQAYQEI